MRTFLPIRAFAQWIVRAFVILSMVFMGTGIAKPILDADAGLFTALVNPNATPETRGLMRYLSSIYGKQMLSGHQMSYNEGTGNGELTKITGWTGEAPATRGFDFMDVINSYGAPHARLGLDWGKKGGIVQLCWHWRIGGGDFYKSAFPAGDPATNATINADLKKLGDELQKYSDARIPVLWRPLHEPPGRWFWWHNGGSEQYKKLWIHMYKYLVTERKLNNLIWVYSGADNTGYKDPAWYPGNAYVDIVGCDGYGNKWQAYYDGLNGLTGGGKKMTAATENKQFPVWTPNNTWLWTISWNNEIFNALGETDFKGLYNHPNTINYDNLPSSGGAITWDKMLPGGVALQSPKQTSETGSQGLTVFQVNGQVFLKTKDRNGLMMIPRRN